MPFREAVAAGNWWTDGNAYQLFTRYIGEMGSDMLSDLFSTKKRGDRVSLRKRPAVGLRASHVYPCLRCYGGDDFEICAGLTAAREISRVHAKAQSDCTRPAGDRLWFGRRGSARLPVQDPRGTGRSGPRKSATFGRRHRVRQDY